MSSRSGRFAAAWLLGAVLAILAMSHVPDAESWAGTTDTVSGSKIVAMPMAKRLADGADLGPSFTAVLPPAVVLPLLAGVAVAALAGPPGRVRSGPRPRAGRGPPLALR